MTDKVIEATVAAAAPGKSPDALLKEAVTASRAKSAKSAKTILRRFTKAADLRSAGIAAVALGIGAVAGAGAVTQSLPRGEQNAEGFGRVQTSLDAGRSEAARLTKEIERLGKQIALVRETSESGVADAKARGTSLNDRIGRMEQALGVKLTSLTERQDQILREQVGKIAALVAQQEKPVSAATPVAVHVPKAVAAEPTQTGSISETKPKPTAIENWAVREVYDGIAVLEDKKRHLIEIGPGDTVPGVGRVEGIERRGRTWVVVTKQGLITQQSW